MVKMATIPNYPMDSLRHMQIAKVAIEYEKHGNELFIMIRLKMNLILQVLFSENLIITANLD